MLELDYEITNLVFSSTLLPVNITVNYHVNPDSVHHDALFTFPTTFVKIEVETKAISFGNEEYNIVFVVQELLPLPQTFTLHPNVTYADGVYFINDIYEIFLDPAMRTVHFHLTENDCLRCYVADSEQMLEDYTGYHVSTPSSSSLSSASIDSDIEE